MEKCCMMKYLFLLLPCIQAFSHKRSFLKMTTSDIFDMSKHPSEIIKSFYGQPIGGEWTYSELLKNLDENHVGAVSISSNNKYAIAIDLHVNINIQINANTYHLCYY